MSETPLPLDQLLAAWDNHEPAPSALVGQLRMADAYTMQAQLLARRIGDGQIHTGWKVGQTAAKMRAERGEEQPAPGFMVAKNRRENGGIVHTEGDTHWFLEPELALVLAHDLGGPDVDAEDVRNAVDGVASGFEIVHRRAGWDDRALQRAVNGSTAGYVIGPKSESCPTVAEVDELHVNCTCDGKSVASLRGGDVNDNPIETAAWLARFLDRHGLQLRAGQTILTGTYAGLLPVRPGQHWRATVGALDPVIIDID
jgi:2-oxopent-4-enoate/cis-2-oxohex-4-enoate hydratase